MRGAEIRGFFIFFQGLIPDNWIGSVRSRDSEFGRPASRHCVTVASTFANEEFPRVSSVAPFLSLPAPPPACFAPMRATGNFLFGIKFPGDLPRTLFLSSRRKASRSPPVVFKSRPLVRKIARARELSSFSATPRGNSALRDTSLVCKDLLFSRVFVRRSFRKTFAGVDFSLPLSLSRSWPVVSTEFATYVRHVSRRETHTRNTHANFITCYCGVMRRA